MKSVKSLSRFALELKQQDIPGDVVRDAKRLIIDTFGCIIGAQKTEVGPLVLSSVHGFGLTGSASIVGRRKRISPFGAAYINGRLGNAMDFDDTHASGIHLATGVITGALAFAEERKLSEEEFLLAVIVGYEVGGRFCRAFGPFFAKEEMGPIHAYGGMGNNRSFPRVWSLAGPLALGAAAAAGRALRLNTQEYVQALAASVYNAPLLQGSAWTEQLVELPNSKYCDAGLCSLVGVQSAYLASTGTTSFPDLLDGDANVIKLFGDQSEAGLGYLTDELGSAWMLRNSTLKPWPSCRLTHQPLTALHKLLTTNTIEPKEIDKIEVLTNRVGCVDRFTQRAPQSFVARQFSIPHMIAMQVMRIPPGPRWLADVWSDDETYRSLIKKTEIITHPEGEQFHVYMVKNEFREMPGGVRVICGSKEFSSESKFALGDPWSEDTRFSDRELGKKFETLVDAGDMAILLSQLGNVGGDAPVSRLMASISDAVALD